MDVRAGWASLVSGYYKFVRAYRVPSNARYYWPGDARRVYTTLNFDYGPGVVSTFVDGLCDYFKTVELENLFVPLEKADLVAISNASLEASPLETITLAKSWQLEDNLQVVRTHWDSFASWNPDATGLESIVGGPQCFPTCLDFSSIELENLPSSAIHHFAFTIQTHGRDKVEFALSGLITRWLKRARRKGAKFILVLSGPKFAENSCRDIATETSERKPWSLHPTLARSHINSGMLVRAA